MWMKISSTDEGGEHGAQDTLRCWVWFFWVLLRFGHDAYDGIIFSILFLVLFVLFSASVISGTAIGRPFRLLHHLSPPPSSFLFCLSVHLSSTYLLSFSL